MKRENIHRWEGTYLAHVPPGSKETEVCVRSCDVQYKAGLVLIESASVRKVTIDDSFNRVKPGKKPDDEKFHPRKYVVCIWPAAEKKGEQAALDVMRWDATGEHYYQGPHEALFRGKIDDCLITGGDFHPYIQANGRTAKQLFQLRHGKLWVIQGSTLWGYNDHGQQRTDGKYEKSQQLGRAVYDSVNFRLWAPGKKLWLRQPGADKIEIAGKCFDPAGYRIKNGAK